MADALVVTARIADGPGAAQEIGVFVVDARRSGVAMKTFRTVVDLRAADVSFHVRRARFRRSPRAHRTMRPGDRGGRRLRGGARCAEAVGAIDSANRATLEYLKTRRQFGVAIGSFQALQHREGRQDDPRRAGASMALLACAKVDAAARGEIGAAERARIVLGSEGINRTACRHVGQEAIQLHGGMGMTIEMKISHTFKRLTMLAQQFGDVDHHLDRFARA